MLQQFLRRLPFIAGALALLAVFAGCHAKDRIAEQVIAAKAREILGPATRYETDVKGLGKNRVDQLTMVGIGVRPTRGPEIERLALGLRDVGFTAQPFRLKSVGHCRLSAAVTESAINAYLDARPTRASRFQFTRVELLDGAVRVSGRLKTPLVGIPASATGRLDVHDGQLDFIPTDLRVAGIDLPTWLTDELAERVNPLVDLSGERYAPLIDDIRVTNGGISFGGTARLLDMR